MTYSIVARDQKTGLIGVAVQSHFFSVGSVVTWGRAGVGVVATQSIPEISYGPLGLELMAAGKSATEALDALLHADSKNETRQVAIIDSQGIVAVHTGKSCIPHAGHIIGIQNSCQANLMSNDTIWGEMHAAFEKNSNLELPERMLESLEAAETAGGDIRGKQSSSILIVSPKISANTWTGRLIDLRVDDHPEPVKELKRLLKLRRGYDWLMTGADLMMMGNHKEASEMFDKALQFGPEIDEMRYWRGLSLLGEGKISEAKPILKKVFISNRGWIEVTRSLMRMGVLSNDPKLIDIILS